MVQVVLSQLAVIPSFLPWEAMFVRHNPQVAQTGLVAAGWVTVGSFLLWFTVVFRVDRDTVMHKLTNCCRRSSGVSYKYSKVLSTDWGGSLLQGLTCMLGRGGGGLALAGPLSPQHHRLPAVVFLSVWW